MLSTTKSLAAPVAQFDGLAGRKFSKAKSIADRLGVCSRTIFRWADAGKITRHKINARVMLFDEAEVLTLLLRHVIADQPNRPEEHPQRSRTVDRAAESRI